MWLDEGFSLLYSKQDWAAAAGFHGFYSPHPPLYFTLIKVFNIVLPDAWAGPYRGRALRRAGAAGLLSAGPAAARPDCRADRDGRLRALPDPHLLLAGSADVLAGRAGRDGVVPGAGRVRPDPPARLGGPLRHLARGRRLRRLQLALRARPAGADPALLCLARAAGDAADGDRGRSGRRSPIFPGCRRSGTRSIPPTRTSAASDYLGRRVQAHPDHRPAHHRHQLGRARRLFPEPQGDARGTSSTISNR